MDVLGWLWWLIASLLSVVWSMAWFLLGGWVSTLAQIAVIAMIFLATKYGWRRAPQELFSRTSAFARFAWAWLRSREPGLAPQSSAGRGRPRTADRRRQPGDVRINVSTMLSLLMMAGFALLATIR